MHSIKKRHLDLRVHCLILLTDCNKIWISEQIFTEVPSNKFKGNSLGGRRANKWGHGRTEIKKLICALGEYAKEPKMATKAYGRYVYSKQPYTFSPSILHCLQNMTPIQVEDT
jgi:hypothetical protein